MAKGNRALCQRRQSTNTKAFDLSGDVADMVTNLIELSDDAYYRVSNRLEESFEDAKAVTKLELPSYDDIF